MGLNLNLNGALAGLGAGLVAVGTEAEHHQGELEQDARLTAREAALANLNHSYREQEATTASTRAVAAERTRDADLLNRRGAELKMEEPYHENADRRATARTAATAATEHGYRMEEMNARERLQFNTWRQQHSITQADQQTYDLWRQEHGVGGEGADHYVQDAGSGHYVAIGRNGATRDTGIAFPARAGADEFGLDGTGGGAAPAAAPAPAGRPAARPTLSPRPPAAAGADTPPVAGARRAPDGNWYVTRNGRNFRVER